MLSQAPSMRLGANKPAKNIKHVRSVFCSDGGDGRDGDDGGPGGVGDDGDDGSDAVDEHTKVGRSKPKPNSYITSLLPPHQCFCHQVYTYYTNVSDFSML